MPDLGEYAAAVLAAYGVTLVLLAVLIAMTVLSARKARVRLDLAEQRAARDQEQIKTDV